MASRAKKHKIPAAGTVVYDIDDLFQDEVEPAAITAGTDAEPRGETSETKAFRVELKQAASDKLEKGAESNAAPKSASRKSKPGQRRGGAKAIDRWQPPRGFRVYSEGGAGPEYFRIHRKLPAPEVFDETLIKLLVHIPVRERQTVFCDGCLFPAAMAAAGGKTGVLKLGAAVDPRAAVATKRLGGVVGEAESLDRVSNLAVLCYDHITGEKAAEAILGAVGSLSEGGILVACFPSEGLLDYSTNIRMEAPNMRNRVHRLCKTHFILRTAGPLMQPAWDILVLTQRKAQVNVPTCKWRFTGSGVLPWQKCNEAFSSAPWLLVETVDQIAAALARCITYPWEPFED